MPWGWGSKERRPEPDAATRAPPPAPSRSPEDERAPRPEAPLAGDTRFRVDDVYTITGLGCVLVGEVEQGSIRPPTSMRLLHGADGAAVAIPVEVVSIMAHRKPVAELLPGTSAGLQVRGIETNPSPFARTRYLVAKGDRLVSP